MALRARLRSLRHWTLAAWLLLAGGVALSLVAAHVWRDRVTQQSAQAFDLQAAQAGATTTSSLSRMDDLIFVAREWMEQRPTPTNAELRRWYRRMDVTSRYHGPVTIGVIERVAPRDVPAFAAALRADPQPGIAAPRGPFKVVPGGARPYYCLLRASVNAAPFLPAGTPLQLDWCRVPGLGVLAASRDTGQFATFEASFGAKTLTVWAPVYRSGSTPPTLAGRRALIRGWVAGIFDLRAILGPVVGLEPTLQVAIARQGAASRAVQTNTPGPTRSGAAVASPVAVIGATPGAGAFHRRFVVEADGRWIVTVSGAQHWGAFTPGRQALLVLVSGLLGSALLFVLVLVLGRSRAAALRLVSRKTEELRHQALHDALTGLPNRTLIADRTQQLLGRARREGTTPAALFLDLDGFKAVNDSYGHHAGDRLLRAVAGRIATALRESDTVGRLGGDEFVVLVESIDPSLVAQRLLDVLREPFELSGGDTICVTGSVGIAVGDRHHYDELLRDADIALYEAKAAGKDRFVVFEHEMQVAVHDRIALEQDLRGALDAGRLSLVYQPTFRLADDAITSFEALARWHHPARGLIMPEVFIPIAEASGLIVEIGRWVVQTACRQAGEWRAAGHASDVAVNVSTRQLEDPSFADDVREAIRAGGIEPPALILEITETALMRDPAGSARRLAELKKIGVRLVIDDFGTGYSSLAYLRQLPVDGLKIDRLFVAEVARSGDAKALIHSLVQLGRTLRLDTVAEGIEDAEQLARLRAADCQSGQGFLLGRPLAAVDVVRFLQLRAKAAA